MWSTIATWQFSLQAVEKAARILEAGGAALDAVELGIHTVESDPQTDCVGLGGFLNAEGILELDAAIMDGDTMKTGAVAAVHCYEHPVSIARAVMEKTRHSILVGEGAERFAREMGMEPTDMENLITAAARRRWEEDRALREPTGHDTIGMVAIDEKGSMAVATSTSGASLKTPGRVGDSPIIGSGFYVETGVGGAAGTGLGEDIMRTCCAFRCVQLMGMGFSPRTAVETVVRTAHETIRHHGGTPDCIALVCMNARGECAGAANHKGFSYAVSDSTGKLDVIFVDPVVDKDGEEEAQR